MRTVHDLHEVLRLPDVRRIEFGSALSVTGEMAGLVTLVAYAYHAGGTGLAAAYVASRTLAAMCVALGIAGVTDRVRRDALLRRLTGLRAILLALAALTAGAGGPPLAVVALAAASSSLSGTYRPLQVAILPWLVRTPAELASSNATAAVLENSGTLAGPLLAGALLLVAPLWVPIALAAGFMGSAVLSLRRLALPDQPGRRRVGRVAREAAVGLLELGQVAPPAGVAVLLFAQTFVRGALTVLTAVLAVKTLALGMSAVGWLNAAIGVGGLLGGAAAAALVRVTRLGRSFIGGLLLWGLPLVAVALVPDPAVAYFALAVVGVGNAVEEVGVFTLVARSVSARVAGRVLCAREFVSLAGRSVGSLAAPLLLGALGIRDTLTLLGAGLAGLALAYAPRFARLDRAMPPPGQEVALLRRLDMFEPLPLAVIELLATDLVPHQFGPGEVAVQEGQPGEHFHLIASGSASVSVRGSPRPPLGRGDCFGEIALLRDVPRTATVVADQPMRTLALDREVFLMAVTGNGASNAAANALATQRLAVDRLPVPPQQAGRPGPGATL